MRKPKYDNRKQSLYIPGEVLELLIYMKTKRAISMSRVVQDAFRLIEANLDNINWKIDGIALQATDFRRSRGGR